MSDQSLKLTDNQSYFLSREISVIFLRTFIWCCAPPCNNIWLVLFHKIHVLFWQHLIFYSDLYTKPLFFFLIGYHFLENTSWQLELCLRQVSVFNIGTTEEVKQITSIKTILLFM